MKILLKEASAPLYKSGKDEEKIESSLFRLAYSEDEEKRKASFIFLKALNESFLEHKIIDLVPEDKKFRKSLKDRCDLLEEEFPGYLFVTTKGNEALSKILLSKRESGNEMPAISNEGTLRRAFEDVPIFIKEHRPMIKKSRSHKRRGVVTSFLARIARKKRYV